MSQYIYLHVRCVYVIDSDNCCYYPNASGSHYAGGSDDLSRFMSFPHTDPLPGSLPATHYSQTKVWYATCSIIHPDYDMLPAVQYKFRLRYDE